MAMSNVGTSNAEPLITEVTAAEAGLGGDETSHLPNVPSSGVRAAPTLAERVEAAAATGARTEAALKDLLRTAKFLSATIATVLEAHSALSHELETLCQLLDGGSDQKTALERRIERLDRVVDQVSRQASRDRQFLVSEHDSFIAMLVADHQRELDTLRAQLTDQEFVAKPKPTGD